LLLLVSLWRPGRLNKILEPQKSTFESQAAADSSRADKGFRALCSNGRSDKVQGVALMPPRSKVAMLPQEVRDELERRIAERAFSGYEERRLFPRRTLPHFTADSRT
jgi:hypothetical protein